MDQRDRLERQSWISKCVVAVDANQSFGRILLDGILSHAITSAVIHISYKELGLTSVPNKGDNGVHASASPFEGLAEKW